MKEKRLTIGIIYNFSRKWMGGVIYILNAIKILNWLDESRKPKIILFYRKDLKRFVDEIEYPYLEPIEWKFPSIYKGYIHSWFTGKNQFVQPMLDYAKLDAIFPMHDYPVKVLPDVKMVCWYADLQHKHYPEYFRRKKLLERDLRLWFILRHTKFLVVSSQSVLNDFIRYFHLDKRKTIQTRIFHFASVVDSFDFLSWPELIRKYSLHKEYFIVSNQFHNHKNHAIILEALGRLKEKGISPVVAMTGKLPDENTSAYISALHDLIEKYELNKQVIFLGVLSRHDQLTLMKYAQAVIQPSFFEGWSTVIEDAISLQVPVIASNLEVNIEQLGEWGTYFDPKRPDELADILENYPVRTDFDKVIYEPYDVRIIRAAESFISIFEK